MKEKNGGKPSPACQSEIVLTRPVAEDGADLHRLVAASPPLDPNSFYCNLLQCSHFASTSVAARMDGRLVGFVSGYRVPERPDTQFVWQIVVAEEARGRGLAKRMLHYLALQPGASPKVPAVRFLETTITPDNQASWALFRAFARDCNAQVSDSVLFDRQRHFGGAHDDEILLRIGPFGP